MQLLLKRKCDVLIILNLSGQTGMDEEFNHLGRGVAAPPSKFQAANMHYNKTKNRYANVLAFDDSRVKLSVLSGIEGSDYINANFIDGYKTRRAFIATQAPIPDTIPDFWRMIWEQESSTVVVLSRETEKGKVCPNNILFSLFVKIFCFSLLCFVFFLANPFQQSVLFIRNPHRVNTGGIKQMI